MPWQPPDPPDEQGAPDWQQSILRAIEVAERNPSFTDRERIARLRAILASQPEQAAALPPQSSTQPAQAPTQAWTPPDPPDAPASSPAEPETPPGETWGQWAGDIAQQVAFPHKSLMSAVGRQIERGGEAAMAFPGQAAELAQQAFTVPAKTLAGDVGLPVSPITPEEDADYRSVMIDLLATMGGAKAGQVIGSHAGDIAKYLGRGFRTATGVERDLPMMTKFSGPMTTATNLASPVISGIAANRFVDWMNPASPFGGGEFGDAIIAGGAGTTVAAGVARNTLTDLMTTNPRWRALMMSPSKGEATALMGAALGYALSRGVPITRDWIEGMISGVEKKTSGVVEPSQRRTSIGPDAIPPPQWGRRF